jgi:DNA invertase Pin-like site-specific DNA recombinase
MAEVVRQGLRFAFYGRVSTEDHQDPESSLHRQAACAQATIAGEGHIVEQFVDIGHTRRKAWPSRPGAARLLAALADPDRGFDAIVIGEYERAFYGNQFTLMAPVFDHYGVSLWMPEAGGLVDTSALAVEEFLIYLGMMSKREIIRARARTMGSMAAQVSEQGRFMGGRAPYGMRYIYPRAHPN